MTTVSDSVTPSPRRFWGTRLHDDVKPGHMLFFYLAAFATIMMAVVINVLQPYVFQTFLGLRPLQFGSAAGYVGFFGELVLVVMVGVWGIRSDRTGRRRIFAMGFVIMAVGFALTPLSDTLGMMAGYRALYSVGIAATTSMLAVIGADYVINADRGKALAIMGIANGLGATVAALALSRLPDVLQQKGMNGIEAGWISYGFCAVLCLIFALLVGIGLKGPGQEIPGAGEHGAGFTAQAREGFNAARRDPGVALSYAAGFVARADLTVAGVFFPTWLVKYQVSRLPPEVQDAAAARAAGLATGPDSLAAFERANEAAALGIAEAGALIGIIGAAGLCFAPVMGILCDRYNRVMALALGLLLNVLGYGLTWFVHDPGAGVMLAAAVLIGFGQVGGVISSQVLIQQQAPLRSRGAVVGAFGTCGALGIMFSLVVGGWLASGWRDAGPFIMLACLNALVILLALGLRRRVRPPADADLAPVPV